MANFRYTDGVSVDAAGNIYVADLNIHRIRKVAPHPAAIDKLTAGDIPFVEYTGFGHIFSSSGIHKTTFDLDSGIVLRSLSYDEANRLDSVIDQFGNTISIERDINSGVPTAIISPDGLRTELTIDANNHLARITFPGGNYYDFEYTPDGLMTAGIDPSTPIPDKLLSLMTQMVSLNPSPIPKIKPPLTAMTRWDGSPASAARIAIELVKKVRYRLSRSCQTTWSYNLGHFKNYETG